MRLQYGYCWRILISRQGLARHGETEMTKLTASQVEAAQFLNAHVGETVLVLTSGYTANVNPQAIRDAAGYATSTALRGLAAKGFVEVDGFWKGANVKVLREIA